MRDEPTGSSLPYIMLILYHNSAPSAQEGLMSSCSWSSNCDTNIAGNDGGDRDRVQNAVCVRV